jgi:ABC-type lipoprotein release transport system permease subunit
MIQTRLRKILRDVGSRRMRTFLVSFSIFIGVFGVVALFSTGELLINQLEEDIQKDRLAMLRITLTSSREAQIDNAAYLAALRTQPGVTVVEGRAVYALLWKLPDEERFRDGTIAAYSEPFDQIALDPPRLTAGEYPVAGQGQITVERRMAERWNLEVGDQIDVRILGGAGGPGEIQQETLTISGIVFQAYGEQGVAGFVDYETLTFATYDDAQHIAGFNGLSHFYARFIDFATAKAESANFQAAIASNSPYVPVFTAVEDPENSPLIENTRTTNQVLVMLAMVALIVSGFLVINVINSIVVEQRRQIGVMKSLGASRFDNFTIYAGIALTYGLLGVIPGVLLGIPGGYFMAQALAEQNNTIIDNFAVSPTGILLGVVVGLAVPLLAAVIPVLNGTRVSILEAMTDYGISSEYGKDLLARLIRALPLPLTLRQAFNNVNQRKFRLALTGTTLTIAVGAFMGIFAVFSSLNAVIQDVFGAFGSHLAIAPTEGQRFEVVRDLVVSTEFQDTLAEKGLAALKAVEPGAQLAIEIEGYDPPPVQAGPPGVSAVGVNTHNPDLLDLNLRSGSDWRDNPDLPGVVISSRIADNMGKDSGDSIVIMAGGGRGTYPILGVAKYPFDWAWMRYEDLAELGGLYLDAPATPHSFAMGTTYVTVAGYDGSFDGETGILGMTTLPGDEASRLLSMVDGVLYTPGADEVIISQEMAEAGGYDVGDTLTLSMGDNSGEYTVTGIFELPAQLNDNPDHPRDVVGMYWQDLAQLEGSQLVGQIYPNSISVILDEKDPSAQRVDAVIEEINQMMLSNGITANYTNWIEFRDFISQFILVFNIILYFAAALIALVGAIGLLTSLSMSVFERQKEIGVMRSVGATSRSVALQFLVEGLTIGLAAWLFGIPLGYGISLALNAALPFEELGGGFPPETIILGLVGMLVVVTIASLWPSLAAARRTISDILRYQ